MNDPLSPARNVDLRQIVYEKIKEAIVEGLIRPGERLSEVDLRTSLPFPALRSAKPSGSWPRQAW